MYNKVQPNDRSLTSIDELNFFWDSPKTAKKQIRVAHSSESDHEPPCWRNAQIFPTEYMLVDIYRHVERKTVTASLQFVTLGTRW